MLVSILNATHQATIPRAVRDALSLSIGECIEFVIEPGGVRLRRAALAGLTTVETTLFREWGSTNDEAAFAEL